MRRVTLRLLLRGCPALLSDNHSNSKLLVDALTLLQFFFFFLKTLLSRMQYRVLLIFFIPLYCGSGVSWLSSPQHFRVNFVFCVGGGQIFSFYRLFYSYPTGSCQISFFFFFFFFFSLFFLIIGS